jgi:hypothetical protein
VFTPYNSRKEKVWKVGELSIGFNQSLSRLVLSSSRSTKQDVFQKMNIFNTKNEARETHHRNHK